ncbi:MAG: DUF2914 domain-containing protein [Alphaproteobacteria bacterium]|nr:DUF2914 domain-containing protein [Alphaproteobacteria bacterium]
MSSPLPAALEARLSPTWRRRIEAAWPLLMPGAFVGGFLLDVATLRRVDDVGDNLQLTLYLLVSAIVLVAERRAWHGRSSPALVRKHGELARLLLQFLFGGLLSAYLLFYSRSATLGPSLLFCSLLASLMLANEVLFPRLRRDGPQLALWFFSAFSYLLFAVPTWTGDISRTGRIAAGVLALLAAAAVTAAIHGGPIRDPHSPRPGDASQLWPAVGRGMALYVAMLLALALAVRLGLVPPVPLALAEAGVYHHVERDGDDVLVSWEPARVAPWTRAFWARDDRRFQWHEGDRVYCYTAVFAPTDTSLGIEHRWQRFDDAQGWVQTDVIPWSMAGGRDGGWRSWTAKRHVTPGEWRVVVATEHGDELGHVDFDVVAADAPARPLKTRRR